LRFKIVYKRVLQAKTGTSLTVVTHETILNIKTNTLVTYGFFLKEYQFKQ